MSKETKTLGLSFGSGIVLGLGLGIATAFLYKEKMALTSQDVLKKVQKHFKKEGNILTSWIHEERVPYQLFAVHTKIYNGGIICQEDEVIATYEFKADAYTGTIISIERTEEIEE